MFNGLKNFFKENRKKGLCLSLFFTFVILEVILFYYIEYKWVAHYCVVSAENLEIYDSCAQINYRLYGIPLLAVLFTSLLYFLPEVIAFLKKYFAIFTQSFYFVVNYVESLSSVIHNRLCAFFTVLLMALLFIKKFGLQIVNPLNTAWLVVDDAGQHFFGWMVFRKDAWSFPLGLEPHLNYPIGTTVGFTDSNPLLALPFKLFRDYLPDTFQYIGLWILVCYLLQGFFSAKLLRSWNCSFFLKLLSSFFIAFSPILLVRFGPDFYHDTLLCHWILLWLIGLYFSTDKSFSNSFIQMNLAVFLASWIHPYTAFMAIALSFAILWKDFLFVSSDNQYAKFLKYSILLIIPVFVMVISFYLIGYFSFYNESQTFSYGDFSFNLNNFFNPYNRSYFIKEMPSVSNLQMEGFSYLGVGTFLLLATVILRDDISILPSVRKKQNLPLLIVLICFFLYAMSNKVSFGSYQFVIHLDAPIRKILGICQSAGRFIWSVYYVFLLFILKKVVFCSASNRKKQVLFCFAFILQVTDLSPLYASMKMAQGNFPLRIHKAEWIHLLEDKKHLIFYPPYQNEFKSDKISYHDFWWLASQTNSSVNLGYFAREVSKETKELEKHKVLEKWKSGKLNSDELYAAPISIFKSDLSKFAHQFNIKCLPLDGFMVCNF